MVSVSARSWWPAGLNEKGNIDENNLSAYLGKPIDMKAGLITCLVIAVLHSVAGDPTQASTKNSVQIVASIKGGGNAVKTNQLVLLQVSIKNLTTNQTYIIHLPAAAEENSAF